MVDFVVLVAYALSFLIPLLIIGIGSTVQEYKASVILAYICLIELLSYYYITDVLPFWILGGILILISLLIGTLFRAVFNSND